MCGIAGYFYGSPNKELLLGMISQLEHRGPDGFGYYIDDQVGLAHSRLSIIDIEGGTQPMTNEDGTIWVTFNGEIYNHLELKTFLINKGHVFKTECDTEIIVHAYEEYGIECASMFNGQFAFALWDSNSNKQSCYLVRDRVGIQPLFYSYNGKGAVYFGSEVKALFVNPELRKGLAHKEIANVFTYWSPSHGNTTFNDVHEVEPGEILKINNYGPPIRIQYWDHDYTTLTAHDKQYDINYHMDNAIDLRLRANVPVAAYLSGGLDSSIIATLASKKTSNLDTFSIRFDDPQYDESIFQNIMADTIGVNHTSFNCTSKDIADVFPDVVYHAEKPMFRTAPAPMFLLSKMVKEQGYKVVLTGEGADEVFAGYDIFRENYVRREMLVNKNPIHITNLLHNLYPWMSNKTLTSSTDYLKMFFGGSASDAKLKYFSHLTRMQSSSKSHKFFKANGMLPTIATDFFNFNRKDIEEDLEIAQYLEFKTLFNGYLMSTQGDRMLMANGVEGRFPFLDPNVVDYGNALEPLEKLFVSRDNVMIEKYVLKEFARTKTSIPSSIINRDKQPYMAPDVVSFMDSNGKFVDYVEHAMRQDFGMFDMKKVNILKRKFEKGIAKGFPENMAFIGILSTQLLHMQIVENFQPKPTVNENRFQVRVNRIG